jgi:hypothetical protein
MMFNNFDACPSCGTMTHVITAVGNYYEVYNKYVGAYLPVEGTINALANRGGTRTPLFWRGRWYECSCDVHLCSLHAVHAKLTSNMQINTLR